MNKSAIKSIIGIILAILVGVGLAIAGSQGSARIGSIPMLEKKADKRWDGQEDYEKYKKNTPVLIPMVPFDKKID